MERDKLIEIRNRLYDNLPKGEVSVFDFIKVIKEHLTELDLLIDSLTAPAPDGKEELFKDEIDSAIDKYSFRVPYDGTKTFYDEEAAKHYEAGIYWALNRLTPKTHE